MLLLKDFTSLYAYMCAAIPKGATDCIHTCTNKANRAGAAVMPMYINTTTFMKQLFFKYSTK